MNLITFILTFCWVANIAAVELDDDVAAVWDDYKRRFSKTYDSPVPRWRKLASALTGRVFSDEESHRKEFEKTIAAIRKHNENPKASFKLGLNQFSDLSLEEVRRKSTGLKLPRNKQLRQPLKASANPKLKASKSGPTFPEELDWVKRGFVTPVADQKLKCSACWTFATTAVIESRQMILNDETASLSVQNLLDCSKEKDGCDGGWYGDALDHVIRTGGLNHLAVYPYQETVEKCTFDSSLGAKYATNVVGYDEIPAGNENAVIEALQSGPVLAAIRITEKFVQHKSGIFDDESCYGPVDHAIAIVGYGKDNLSGKKYWIIKNSWGVTWGEQGYGRIIRKNICGLLDHVVVPKLSPLNNTGRFFGGALSCSADECAVASVRSTADCPTSTERFLIAKSDSTLGYSQHQILCVKQRADPDLNFGGMYFKCDTCNECSFSWQYNTPNPLTGDYTCPKGYGKIKFRMLSLPKNYVKFENVGCTKTVCFNKVEGGIVGGFYQQFNDGLGGEDAVPNPVTGQFNCPNGYDRKMYGTAKAPDDKYRHMTQYYCLKSGVESFTFQNSTQSNETIRVDNEEKRLSRIMSEIRSWLAAHPNTQVPCYLLTEFVNCHEDERPFELDTITPSNESNENYDVSVTENETPYPPPSNENPETIQRSESSSEEELRYRPPTDDDDDDLW